MPEPGAGGAAVTRQRLIAALLQAEEPLSVEDLGAAAELATEGLAGALRELLAEHLVVSGALVPDDPRTRYQWAAYREEALRRQEREEYGQALLAVTSAGSPAGPAGPVPGERVWLDQPAVLAFHARVIGEYQPPADKPFLVFFQCSVRRPFSSSPSHASLRRAVQVATGLDPARQAQRCPVHVVVLASCIGPVPYELEGIYPANVGGIGVKQFSPEAYASARPVLEERMAEYLMTHGRRYRQIAAFAEGRYGEVLAGAARRAAVAFPILPEPGGPSVVRMGSSRPRTYWAKYWVQLARQIMGWLPAAERAAAEDRLQRLGVVCDG